MAYVELADYPFSFQLVDYNKLRKDTLNPCDYLDFGSRITVETSQLSKIADVKSKMFRFVAGVKRIKANHVNRTTGEIAKPMIEEFGQLSCIPVNVGDIIVHKYGCRIGRIGIVEFEGQAEHHFIKVTPRDVEPYYLLFALRSIPVLFQLPFRETARPGIRKADVEHLNIPRLESEIEEKIAKFLQEIFFLRRRASKVIQNLLKNFDKSMMQITPQENAFLIESEKITERTLDPGNYFIWLFEKLLTKSFRLGNEFEIIHPPTLVRGTAFLVITAKNFTREGVIPQLPRDVSFIKEKNYAYPKDVLLNRISSEKLRPWKATVLLSNLDYLRYYGINVDKIDDVSRIPVSEDVFILRCRNDNILPFYLALVLNSTFFQKLLEYAMGGSTGMQVLRKTKLRKLLIPKLENHIMESFADAHRISLLLKNETLKSLTALNRLYEDVICGTEQQQKIMEFINNENKNLRTLSANMSNAEQKSIETANFTYSIEE